jgi:hypothetical protein
MNNETLRLPNRSYSDARKPYRPKPWSHQNELKSLIGETIVVMYPDGTRLTGDLLNADQFTLQVRVRSEEGCVIAECTFFKHAIVGYGKI